jgi:transcriptional regulator with XRE-family HTH domain
MADDLNEYRLAVENLKARLREKDITYAELADGIGMSESGVKKIFTGSDGSFQRLAQICRYAGVTLGELFQDRAGEATFTPEQQDAFLKEPELFQFYWMIAFERRTVGESEKFFRITRADGQRQLKRLQELGLLKLLPGDRLRLPQANAIHWSGDGPFLRKIYQDWSQKFVARTAKPESDLAELFILRYFRMLPETYFEFLEAQRALESEFTRRATEEMRGEDPRLQHVRWLAAVDDQSFVED